MMLLERRSQLIAESLSGLWYEARRPEFRDYIRQVYQIDTIERPDFRFLGIAEAGDGDMKSGPKGGAALHWWIMDGQGLREVQSAEMDWEGESVFVRTAFIKFYQEGNGVAVSERLGQGLICWRTGHVDVSGDQLTITYLSVSLLPIPDQH